MPLDHTQQLHLSHEQLCDHILESAEFSGEIDHAAIAASKASFQIVENHLRACRHCAAEYFALENSLVNFRDAFTGFANEQLGGLKSSRSIARKVLFQSPQSVRFYAKPRNWAAAAALLIASFVPLALHRHAAAPVTATADIQAAQDFGSAAAASVTDEALLEEIDNDLSSSVPTAMQPLADPLTTQTALASNSAAERKNSNE